MGLSCRLLIARVFQQALVADIQTFENVEVELGLPTPSSQLELED